MGGLSPGAGFRNACLRWSHAWPSLREAGGRMRVTRVNDPDRRDRAAPQAMAPGQRSPAGGSRQDPPGVGVLSATAAVAAMGDPSAFKSGREFAAWLGLVPRHEGTGGRVRMLGISKRGDTYLRTLLIHGARSVFSNSKAPPEWALRVAERRPANVATVALANKMARTIWALLAHDRAYHANFVCQAA